jgi:hypothetical protein
MDRVTASSISAIQPTRPDRALGRPFVRASGPTGTATTPNTHDGAHKVPHALDAGPIEAHRYVGPPSPGAERWPSSRPAQQLISPDHASRLAFLLAGPAHARRRSVRLDRCASTRCATHWGLICLVGGSSGHAAPWLRGRTAGLADGGAGAGRRHAWAPPRTHLLPKYNIWAAAISMTFSLDEPGRRSHAVPRTDERRVAPRRT